ncbi:MAG: hypothetical protein LAT67_05015 [Balneolales bacterium]|nr:hypothetical protein [Balneolales bacterium]
MNTNLLKLFIVLCLMGMAALLSGCEGDQGPTGPEGPEGPEGPAGSVDIVSFEYVLGQSNLQFTNASSAFWQRTSNEITAEIAENGVVLAYNQRPGQSTWNAMPIAFEVDGFVGELSYQFMPGIFLTSLFDYGGDVADYTSIFLNSRTRVVLIPPGVSLSNIDTNDIDAVTDFLQLSFE